MTFIYTHPEAVTPVIYMEEPMRSVTFNYKDEYTNQDFTMEFNQLDADLGSLVNAFRGFLYAISFPESAINDYLGERE